jgi:SAM-dependent methyltransferase
MPRNIQGSDHGGQADIPASPSPGISPWEQQYRDDGRIWGEGPGELARIALGYLDSNLPHGIPLAVLDLGCGYGRDSIAYAQRPGCRILGIDQSETAIARAREAAGEAVPSRVEFRCGDLRGFRGGPFDIVHLSNVYQILPPPGRHSVREVMGYTLKPGGLLFLSTLSIRDPQQYGKGTPVEDEEHSFIEPARGIYVHFCTGDELARDFHGFEIVQLREHEFTEARVGGDHHHISWILIARKPVSRSGYPRFFP